MVFNYNSDDVVAEIVTELDRRLGCASIFHAAGAESVGTCTESPASVSADVYGVSSIPVPGDFPAGVRAKIVFGEKMDFVKPIFEKFLPRALVQKRYVVAPEPMIVSTRGLRGFRRVMRY
jgi:hypothetical protein